jgi:outer membrane protein assembly factor BamE (lipoprotein component of BamABCDE complex)
MCFSKICPRLVALILVALGLGVLGGCSSFKSRAKEKASVYGGLDVATQARLEARDIQVGDTEDMVYIALGRPDERREQVSVGGKTATWVYSVFWQEYQDTRMVGYRREVFYDPVTKSYRVINRPDYQPVYTPRAEDRLKVTFTDGRVSVVEQAQDKKAPKDSALK